MNKTIGRVLGPLGLLFLLFSVLSYVFIFNSFHILVIAEAALGLGFIGAFLATAFEDVRSVAVGRGWSYVVSTVVSVVALVAIVVGANYKAYKSGKEWDLTKNGIHTLAEQTQTLVKGLTPNTKVTVYAFFQVGEPGQAHVEELLKRYKNLNPDNFDYEFPDVYQSAALAKSMNITASGPRIVFKNVSGKESRAKELSEEALTNALADLGQGSEKTIYFLTGHSEKSITEDKSPQGYKALADVLKQEGFKSAELSLLAKNEVPADAALVVIAGPVSALAEAELTAIKNYAAAGGRLAVFLDPLYTSGLEAVVTGWGAEPMKGVIVDRNIPNQPLVSVGLPSLTGASPNPIVKNARTFAIFAEARGIRKGNAEGYNVTEVFATTEKSWSEGDSLDANGGRVEPGGPNDVPGPIPLGVAITRKLEGDKEFRAVVFGDSDFASNSLLPQYGNRDLAANIMQWLAGQDSKITIRPKLREKTTIAELTADKQMLLAFGSLNVLPLLLVSLGLTVWSLRRSK
jgi:hypothetical protein